MNETKGRSGLIKILPLLIAAFLIGVFQTRQWKIHNKLKAAAATELPNKTRYGPLGAVGVQILDEFTLEKFLDEPIPGVKTLVMLGSKNKVDRAHEHGYFVITWTWPTASQDVCTERAKTGADALVTDEIGGASNAAEIFNKCKEAAKQVNPNILVGAVECRWSKLKRMMENGAQPDFVGGEIYNCDINLEKLNQLKEEYGVKTHMWAHGVNPSRDLSYIGEVELLIFADVSGNWGCMNQPCGPYLGELKESALKRNWRTCYACPWDSNEEFCCGDDEKCAGGENSCGLFNCLADVQCNNKIAGQNGCLDSCQHTSSPTPTPTPGDANGDGRVDKADLELLKQDYLGEPVNNTDFNSDGRVDSEDFAILQANYSD